MVVWLETASPSLFCEGNEDNDEDVEGEDVGMTVMMMRTTMTSLVGRRFIDHRTNLTRVCKGDVETHLWMEGSRLLC